MHRTKAHFTYCLHIYSRSERQHHAGISMVFVHAENETFIVVQYVDPEGERGRGGESQRASNISRLNSWNFASSLHNLLSFHVCASLVTNIKHSWAYMRHICLYTSEWYTLARRRCEPLRYVYDGMALDRRSHTAVGRLCLFYFIFHHAAWVRVPALSFIHIIIAYYRIGYAHDKRGRAAN